MPGLKMRNAEKEGDGENGRWNWECGMRKKKGMGRRGDGEMGGWGDWGERVIGRGGMIQQRAERMGHRVKTEERSRKAECGMVKQRAESMEQRAERMGHRVKTEERRRMTDDGRQMTEDRGV
jgi:hypothetical protein